MSKKDDQEVVSTDKKDRRDCEHISAIATRMGLHCRQYKKKHTVCSKVSLPNYRPDLDVKHPQREKLIFDKPEDGIRKIMLATNMAERSITVNDVVFVVDCGKAKETSYDAINNTPYLLPSWISKASARQLSNRNSDVGSHDELSEAVRFLVSEDQCEGKFVYGRNLSPKKSAKELQKNVISTKGSGGENLKSHLKTLLAWAGHQSPSYKITQLKNNKFRATVIFNGLNFVGQPSSSKKEAEKDAAAEALLWLTGETESSSKAVEHMLAFLKKSKSKKQLHSTKWRKLLHNLG